jgi:DNA-directed RNA polymerase subunit F
MNPTIEEQIPIHIYELKKEITKIKKRSEELGIRSGKTEEYLNQFLELKMKDAESLEADLIKLAIPRLKDFHIKKLIDLLPASEEELKIVLQGYTLTVTKDSSKKIVDTIKKYLPEDQ